MTQDAARKGDWIQTYTGKQFWPLDPRPEDVDIDDIAQALSNLCRYAGHVREFYSVAEHSCLLAWALRRDGYDRDVQRWALMHDAPEAYIVDVPRPIKRFIPGYKEIESRVEKAVAEHFGLPLEIPKIVHEYDLRICNDERQYGMNTSVIPWGDMGDPLVLRPWFYPPKDAKYVFLSTYANLFG